MYNLLRKLLIVLICSVILMILVAAGADETGIHMVESISNSVQSVEGGYAVIIGLFSAWLVIVGVMCRKLNSIPGVDVKQSGSANSEN